MAEKGTFIGEVQRGLHSFWSLKWKVKGPIMGVAVLVIIAAIGSAGGSDDGKVEAAQPADTTTAAAATQPAEKTAQPTEAPKATNTPAPADTPKPTPAPLTFEQQVAKSYKDNKSFMIRAADDPQVTWDEATGTLVLKALDKNSRGAGDALTVTGHSALVAGRAIWSTYPQVQHLQFTSLANFIDGNGNTTVEIDMAIMVDRAQAELFNYDGLKDRETLDNKSFFCTAGHYFIRLSSYIEIKDKGCLGLPGKDPDPMVLG